MKRIFTLFAAALLSVSLSAQTYNMLIHQKSGEVTKMKCGEIEKITFEEAKESLTVPVEVVETGVISMKAVFDKPEVCKSYYVYLRPNTTKEPANIVAEIKSGHQYEFTQGGEHFLDNIPYNTEYTIYTLAFDETGNEGDVAKTVARTQDVTTPLFDISITNITTNNADVKITPLLSDMTYVHTTNTKSGYDKDLELYGSALDADKNFWQFIGDNQSSAMSWLEILNAFLETGEITYKAKDAIPDMRGGTEHIVYCYGINKQGEMTTPLYKQLFTTIQAAMSDNQITVEILQTNRNSVDIKITTTNDDQYYVTAQRSSSMENFKDNDGNIVKYQEMVDWLMDYPVNSNFMSGNQDLLHVSASRADTDYYLIVFGFDGVLTTTPVVVPFHTQP